MKRGSLRLLAISLGTIVSAFALIGCNNAFGNYDNPNDPESSSASGSATSVSSSTVAGHTLTSDETWSGSIALTGTIIIPSGYTLTIEPGTVVNVTADTSSSTSNKIQIEATGGTLSAIGTSSKLIVIRSAASSPAKDDWHSLGASSGTMTLKYCVVQDAYWGVFDYSSGSTVTIENCVFNNCTEGICAFGAPTVKNNSFVACTYGYWGYYSGALSYCSFESNTTAIMASDSGTNISASYSNFSSNSTDLEVFGSNTSSTTTSNCIINASYCYPASLTQSTYGSYNTGCSINVTNGSSSSNSTAGCGFSYSSYARKLAAAGKAIGGSVVDAAEAERSARLARDEEARGECR